MRRTASVLVQGLLFTTLLIGCTLTRGSSVVVGKVRPPINPESVKLYTTLPAKYEQVALVSADSRNDFASAQNLTDAAINRLKREAARVGANGILLEGIGNYQIGASGVVIPSASGSGMPGTVVTNTRSGKEAKGIAIYVIEE